MKTKTWKNMKQRTWIKQIYNMMEDAASWVYGSLISAMFFAMFFFSQMSFTIDAEALLGPGALVIGMVGAILYLVKRDKEMRDLIKNQNDDIIKNQRDYIKELQQEINELRKRQ